jgi:hypothetical protein
MHTHAHTHTIAHTRTYAHTHTHAHAHTHTHTQTHAHTGALLVVRNASPWQRPIYMACTECVKLSQIERAACYKSVHSIKFVSLLPHFASHCNTGAERMAMRGVNKEGSHWDRHHWFSGGRLNGWVAFQFGLRVLIWILWGICYTVAPQMWRPVSVTCTSCFL